MAGCIRETGACYVAFLVLALNATASANDVSGTRIVQTAERGKSMWQIPGMAVAVVDSGEVVLQRGFGQTTAEGVAVDEHTLFANASTTKAMVVAGLLILADEEKLSLDDPVIDHLPEVHFHRDALTQQVTIRDLLAHRTGLPRTDFWTFRQLTPLDEQVRKLRLVEPEAAPRTRLIYQNTMFELAGLIIERVSGQRWDAFLDERLWQPIGMRETFGTRGQIPGNLEHVMPHAKVDDTVRVIPWDLPADLPDAAGSAWSSIHDMTKWARFLLRDGVTESGERLISQDGMAAMFEPHQFATPDDFYPTVELTNPNWRTYGLGWFQQDFDGRKIDFHTGSLDGLVAIIGLDRAGGRAVVVMANMDGAELRHALLWDVMDDSPEAARRDWANEVFNLYRARADEQRDEWTAIAEARLEGTEPSLALEAYLGTWHSEILGDIELRQNASRLVLSTGMYDYDVSHWHLDTFLVNYLTWSRGTFASFSIDPEGEAATLDVFGHTFRRP